MEPRRNLLPTEIHDGNEGGLHKEGYDTLDGQRCTENVAYEPGIVRPVGAELKLQNDTCGYAHGEVNAEEALPEHGCVAPEGVTLAIPEGLADAHDDCQSEGQRNEQPVIDCRERKLCSGPVDGTGVDV